MQDRRQRLARIAAAPPACPVCGRLAHRRRQGQASRGVIRMTAGMCQACYEAWRYAGKPDRGEWVPKRRQGLTGRDLSLTAFEGP